MNCHGTCAKCLKEKALAEAKELPDVERLEREEQLAAQRATERQALQRLRERAARPVAPARRPMAFARGRRG